MSLFAGEGSFGEHGFSWSCLGVTNGVRVTMRGNQGREIPLPCAPNLSVCPIRVDGTNFGVPIPPHVDTM